MLIIDCHAHVYSDDPARYPPRPDPLRRPPGEGTAEHLRAVSRAAGVSAVRAIQTLTYYGFDNRYLCDTAKANPDWVSGVVTLDPDNLESPALLKRYVREYGVGSLRSLPSEAQQSFAAAGVRALWRTAAEEGITIDLFLMQPGLAPSAATLLGEFPHLTVGFCHCMDLRPGANLDENLQTVLSLSRFPNLHPKVDFVATGTQVPYPCADLHDACLAIIRAYGAERCLWGSCYPNALWTPQVSYSEHIRLFTEALPLTEAEKRLILGENARRIWFPHLAA